MRACFLGPSVCTLGYGVAIVQTPPAEDKPSLESLTEPQLDMPADALPLPNRMFAELRRQPHYS